MSPNVSANRKWRRLSPLSLRKPGRTRFIRSHLTIRSWRISQTFPSAILSTSFSQGSGIFMTPISKMVFHMIPRRHSSGLTHHRWHTSMVWVWMSQMCSDLKVFFLCPFFPFCSQFLHLHALFRLVIFVISAFYVYFQHKWLLVVLCRRPFLCSAARAVPAIPNFFDFEFSTRANFLNIYCVYFDICRSIRFYACEFYFLPDY